MKKLSLIAGGLAVAAALTGPALAADHLDSLGLAGMPMADINDVYTWMTSDASKLNLAMTISPADDGTRSFSNAFQYAFHVWSRGTTPATSVAMPGGGVETQVICTFASNTSIQCWVVTGTTVKDYVTGDPTAMAGLASADGKLRVFAGRRSDPFFFNLQGFRSAIGAIEAIPAAGLGLDASGCPAGLMDAQVAGVRGVLAGMPTTGGTAPTCPTTTKDCFAALNVMAIVVQADKTLFNDGANINLAVYATTHAKP